MPAGLESYQYDPLYRLQQVNDQTGTLWQSYSYDKTGDRLSKTTQGITPVDMYDYTTGTHHLIGISGYDASNRAFDANGNTTAFQANGWIYGLGYDDRNRLRLVQQNGSTITTYALDGKGERVRKVPTSGQPTGFAYDEQGKLLAEFSSGGARDYVWADDTLVATVNGSSGTYYVHTDHLGTPRAVTTTSGTLIWAWPWLKNPFGEQPASGSAYTLNLRYPGQYYDSETGLNYNLNRDYEPGTGRYIESDPLGLTGGASTYAYASSSPMEKADPTGYFAILANYPVSPDSWPTVVCDGSGGMTIFYGHRYTPKQLSCFKACITEHEQVHIDDYSYADATAGTLACVNKPAGLQVYPTSTDFRNRSEARAYQKSLDCLKAKLKTIKNCDKCRVEIQNEITNEEKQLITYGSAL